MAGVAGNKGNKTPGFHGPDDGGSGRKSGLTEMQIRFCEEYLIDLNAKVAAERAGFSKKTSNEQGYQLMQRPHVLAYIAYLREEQTKRTGIDADWVLQRFKDISDRCTQAVPVMKFNPISKQMEQQQEVNEEGEMVGVYMFDSAGANKSTEMIGKHIGFFEKDNAQARSQVNVGDTNFKIEKRKRNSE